MLSFLLIVLSTVLLSINLIGFNYLYKVGDIARESIRVPWEIVYPIDLETEQERRFAAETTPPVYEKDPYVLAEKTRFVNNLFNNVETVLTSRTQVSREEQLKILEEMLPINHNLDKKILYSILTYSSIEELRRIILSIINNIYDKGVIDDLLFTEQADVDKNILVVTQADEKSYTEEKRHYRDLYELSKFKATLHIFCAKYTADLPKNQQWAVFVVVKGLLRANVRYDNDETRKRMENASLNVKPVMGILKKGQVVAREGDSITNEVLQKINAINKYTRMIHVNYIIGVFLIQMLVYVLFMFFMSGNYHKIIPDAKAPYAIGILLLFFMLYTYFVNNSFKDQESFAVVTILLPIPFITMMVSILYNVPLAVIVSSCIAFFTFTIVGGDYTALGITVSSILMSIFGTRHLERRTDFLKSGLVIGIVNAIVILGLSLMEEQSFSNIGRMVYLALVSGVLNAMAVIGIFPVFEHFFGITTIFKLYELSDLNAPIFKKMLIRAPGTYNHSIMVANMAEAACRDIGADFLLARVGGYYHDIGKIDNAHIFIENKKNPNEPVDLPPKDYSKIIISHVEKGIEIAKKTNLPKNIIDFIREHHGDSMMTYFYHQALEKAQASGDLDSVHRSYFQYPGPKPHSKETAIVMLADAVEAASRSVQEPSYAKLESLVKKIISTRLNEGDLEHSDLTMQDLTAVQKSFLQILNGIFHTRLEYPQNDEIRKLEEKVKGYVPG